MRRTLIKSATIVSMDDALGETDFIATVKRLERLSGLGEPKL
jgi:hypothetical protein